jgi:hypothetical protein
MGFWQDRAPSALQRWLHPASFTQLRFVPV